MTSAQVNAQKAEQSLKLHLNEAVTPGRLPGGGGVGPSPSDRPHLLGKRRDRAVAVTEGSPGSGSCSQHALGRAPRAARATSALTRKRKWFFLGAQAQPRPLVGAPDGGGGHLGPPRGPAVQRWFCLLPNSCFFASRAHQRCPASLWACWTDGRPA